MKLKHLWCEYCQGKTKHVHGTTNHVLHFILSIVTAGFWIFVWLLIVLNNMFVWHCDACGKQR